MGHMSLRTTNVDGGAPISVLVQFLRFLGSSPVRTDVVYEPSDTFASTFALHKRLSFGIER